MAIRGLTHQQPEFPEIGQLRKGDKKTEATRPGKDLTYFRFTSDVPGVVAAFANAYDGEPRLINVFLPHRTTDENWFTAMEEWVAGGLVHRCDREYILRIQGDNGEYLSPEPGTVRCPYHSGEKPRTKEQPGCRPVGRLKVIIPELGRLAYVTVLTGAWNDVKNLDAQLRALEDLSKNHDLRGIPLQLRRRLMSVSTPEVYPKGHPQQYQRTGKRVRRQKWLLCIEAAPSWVALEIAALQVAALPSATEPKAITGAVEDEPLTVDGTTGEILEAGISAPDDSDWDEELFETGEDKEPEPPPPPQPKAPRKTNGKCPICHVTGDGHAPWCQDGPDGHRFDIRTLDQDNGVAELPADDWRDEIAGVDEGPLGAEHLRDQLRLRAGWTGNVHEDGVAITEKQVGYLASLMTGLFPNLDGKMQDKARIDMLRYLYGPTITSSKQLTKAEASALIDHIAKDPQGALLDAARILQAVAVNAGQFGFAGNIT